MSGLERLGQSGYQNSLQATEHVLNPILFEDSMESIAHASGFHRSHRSHATQITLWKLLTYLRNSRVPGWW